MHIINGCVIGFGKLGLLQLSQFSALPGVKIDYICETNKTVLTGLSQMFNSIKIVDHYTKIPLKNLDFVIVTAPSGLHFEIIKYFLNNGIPVFSEKPLTSKYQDALILKKIAESKKVLLFTGYMYQFFETFALCEELILKKKILGELFFLTSEMYVSQYLKKKKLKTWRFNKKLSGGGVVITQTSHLIYYICRLLGHSNKVFAILKNIYSDQGIEDFANILIEFEKNIPVTINCSWSINNYRTPYVKIFFQGKNGNILLTEDKIEIFLNEKKENFNEGLNVIKIPEIKKGVYFDVAGSHYAAQANYFLELLKKNKIDIKNLESSLETQNIINKIYHA